METTTNEKKKERKPRKPREKHSKVSFANTIDRAGKVAEASRKSLFVYVRSRYNAAKVYITPGTEDAPAFRKELKEIAALLDGIS